MIIYIYHGIPRRLKKDSYDTRTVLLKKEEEEN